MSSFPPIRRTNREWESKNPILDKGRFGYDTTNNLLKVGDGVTPWLDLPLVAAKTPAILDGGGV